MSVNARFCHSSGSSSIWGVATIALTSNSSCYYALSLTETKTVGRFLNFRNDMGEMFVQAVHTKAKENLDWNSFSAAAVVQSLPQTPTGPSMLT